MNNFKFSCTRKVTISEQTGNNKLTETIYFRCQMNTLCYQHRNHQINIYLRKPRQVQTLDRQGISVKFLCLRNNHKITVIFQSKPLFLVHVSVTRFSRFASAVTIRFSQSSCFRLWIQLSVVTYGVQLPLGVSFRDQDKGTTDVQRTLILQ